jgi:hypothetical protein
VTAHFTTLCEMETRGPHDCTKCSNLRCGGNACDLKK